MKINEREANEEKEKLKNQHKEIKEKEILECI